MPGMSAETPPPTPWTDHFERESLEALGAALDGLESGFDSIAPARPAGFGEPERETLFEVADRLAENFPYFHPLYAGQMLKPPHPLARAAYALAMWINPNNHALDGGRASSAMEKEAVAQLAEMFGWPVHLGHLTSGGTMANLEALWIAGLQREGQTILASSQAHYTHSRITDVLRLKYEPVPTDARGRMDLGALAARLDRGGVGTVVATMGTTALGAVDSLDEILALRERHGFRVHADAVSFAGNLGPEARRAFDALTGVDSLVIDPHKHGLQPYGCGCVLFRDPAAGRHYRHDSPYTYFSSGDLHLGEISLECSRPGASAVALWATQRHLPLVPGGEFAHGLERGHEAAKELHRRLAVGRRWIVGPEPELDIVTWAARANTVDESSRLARRVFEEAALDGLHLALADLPAAWFGFRDEPARWGTVTCLRSVLMKREHLDWLDAIGVKLAAAADRVFGRD